MAISKPLTARQQQILDLHRGHHQPAGLPAVGARDRRRGGPQLPVHRPLPPQHAPAPRLPAPRPHQAPRHRGALRPHVGRVRPRPSPGGATSRWWATWPPAPTCWPRRTSRRSCPLPSDFTGEGDLFMLRVRGDSMIDAGILDGDFIVARSQTNANTGDIVVAGIPGEEATVKTYSTTEDQHRAAPGQRAARADGVRPVGGLGVRQGRHRDAQALTCQPSTSDNHEGPLPSGGGPSLGSRSRSTARRARSELGDGLGVAALAPERCPGPGWRRCRRSCRRRRSGTWPGWRSRGRR